MNCNNKGYDGYQQRYTYNAQGHMIRKESKGNDQRQTLEEIVRGDEKKAASDDGGDDDSDPYASKSASDSWQVTSYIYDVTAPYYEVLAETTDGVTISYDYGVERLAAYPVGSWNAQKTEYVYDGRGSVARVKDCFTTLLHPQPTYLGEAIPVSGNGNLTND